METLKEALKTSALLILIMIFLFLIIGESKILFTEQGTVLDLFSKIFSINTVYMFLTIFVFYFLAIFGMKHFNK